MGFFEGLAVVTKLGTMPWREMERLKSAEGQEKTSNLKCCVCYEEKFGEKSRLQVPLPGVAPRIGEIHVLARFIRQLHISYSIATYFRQDRINLRPISNHPTLPGYHACTSIALDADVFNEFHKYQRTPGGSVLCGAY